MLGLFILQDLMVAVVLNLSDSFLLIAMNKSSDTPLPCGILWFLRLTHWFRSHS